MAKQPNAADSLSLWCRPQFFETLAHGDPVPQWNDQAGSLYHFTEATPANQPLLEVNARWGYPALKFNGTSSRLIGTDFNNVLGSNTCCFVVSFYLGQITGFKQTIVCDGSNNAKLIVLEDGRLQAFADVSGGNKTVTTLTPLSIGWHVACWWYSSTLGFRLFVDDPLAYKSVPGGGNLDSLGLVRLGTTPSNTDWFGPDGLIGELLASPEAWTDQNRALTFSWMMRWTERAEALPMVRDMISRRLKKNERPRLIATVDGPYEFLDNDISTPHAILHPNLPHPLGLGGQLRVADRQLFNLHRRVDHLSKRCLSMTFLDRTGLSNTYEESGVAEQSSSPERLGVKIHGLGVARVHEGGTRIWVEAPDTGLVASVLPGVEAAETGGIYTQEATNQLMLRSSFQDGATGLTLTGSGVNGSSRTVEEQDIGTPILFDPNDPESTEFHLKYTAGSPHAADLYDEWPLTVVEEPIPANARLTMHFHKLDNGGPSNWGFQRDVDNWWWNNVTKAFQATFEFNESSINGRDRSEVIMWGATPGRARFRFGLKSGGVASRFTRLFHVQCETLPYPTGIIVQDNAFIGPRSDRALGFFETELAKMLNADAFTVAMVLTPPWSDADMEAGTHTIPGGLVAALWIAQYENPPTQNYITGRFRGDLGAGLSRWELAVNGAGSEVMAYNDLVMPERDTPIALVFRRTSATAGELGLPPNTLDVFANGLKGTSEVVSTPPTLIDNSRVQFNMRSASCRRIYFDYNCWSDERIVAWSKRLELAA